MNPVLGVILLGVGGGFAVAVVTSSLLGKEKARKFPGGSFFCGIVAALAIDQTALGFIVLGAVCGLVGWGIYLFLSRPRH